MIFDTHAHYNLSPLLEVWPSQWQRAREAGVSDTLIASSTLQDSQEAIHIARQDPHLYAAAGIHPDEAAHLDSIEVSLHQLQAMIKTHRSEIAALGEIGLDYYWLKDESHRAAAVATQQKLLVAQLELAQDFQLPIMLHVRDQETPETETPGNAYWDLLTILQSAITRNQSLNCVLHCISGPANYVKAAVKLGCYIGVDGNVTYKNATHLRDLIKLVPTDRLLVETDAPYLPPIPYRGRSCEPWMISLTVDFLEAELSVNRQQLYQNAINFLKI